MVRSLALLALLVGCRDVQPETLPEMDAVDALIRVSLDLRGVRPLPADIREVLADESALEGKIDAYLVDERVGARVADMYSEIYLTETESFPIGVGAFDELTGVSQQAFQAAVGQEPLRFIEEVVKRDLPWTTLVTADWTMTNEITGAIWPVDYPAGQTGWQQTRYTDTRPNAGVLSMNSMWWRYGSTASNANRKRANAVSRILLCHDYLVRPIDFDRNVNLLDEASVLDALNNNPSCVNCHVSLDPLSSYFYGFWYVNAGAAYDAVAYHPEREQAWRDITGVAPGYYGEPGYSLADLGVQIASDTRFADCAVQQAWENLVRRDADLADESRMLQLREAFLAGGLTHRALLGAVVRSPEYLAGPTDAPGAVPLKMTTPGLLVSQIEDLTGYRWTANGVDLLRTDAGGYRMLAGGADGYAVTETARQPNATILLVAERLAEAAAWHAVNTAVEEPETSRLLPGFDPAWTPASHPSETTALIAHMHLALFGHQVAADGPEIEANLALWQALYEVEDSTTAAWSGLLSALLRDPDFLFY